MSSPFVSVLAQTDHDAQGTAATTESPSIGEVQFDATVTEISIVPDAAMTADNTNNRQFQFINKGQSGVGTTVLGTYLANVAGGSLVAFDEKLVTLTATAADLNVSAGDVLAMVETVNGTGLAHPRMQVTVRGVHR